MAKNDTRTRAFDTTAKKKKGNKSKGRIRQQIVVSIFAVIALILVMFATLIIGKIIMAKKDGNPSANPPSVHTVPREATAIHIGNLLLINDEFKYTLPQNLDNMINVKYQYLPNDADQQIIKIGNVYTYTLTYDSICLTKETLDMFSQMVFDYCTRPGFTVSNDNAASNLEIAWGGYSETTRHEYQEDINNIGKDFYDHALGTTITLKINSPSTPIKESILKEQFEWIYQNAHRYGFIIRYPNDCSQHTGISDTRIHLRYVGIEHATYIFNKGICLEKYLELIRNQHGYDNPLEVNSADGKTYQVYYVAYSGNPTSIPVPKDKDYYISGDNMNGFIVTVEK